MLTMAFHTTYNIDFELCSFFFALVVAVYSFFSKRPNNMKDRVFSSMMIASLVTILLDIITAYTLMPKMVDEWVNYFLLIMLFTFQNALTTMIVYYVLCLAQIPFKSKFLLSLISVPFIACEIMLLLTPFNHLMFYFNENGQYIHNALFYGMYGMNMFYLALSSIEALIFRKRINRGQSFTIIIFSLFILGAAVTQCVVPELMMIGWAIGLSVMMFYLSLQNPKGYVDELTGVFNRSSYMTALREVAFLRHRRYVTLIALDDMKVINSTYSFDVGNEIISGLGHYLDGLGYGEVYRLVGDEFAVISRSSEDSIALADAVHNRLKLPWVTDGFSVSLAACICYGAYIDGQTDLSDFMLICEQALLNAKKQGRNTVVCVDDIVVSSAKREIEIENALRLAVRDDMIDVYYQPIYCIATESYTAAEALARFENDKLGKVSPGVFIPLAEKNGLIVPLDNQLLRKVAKFIHKNKLCGGDNAKLDFVDVNLSAVELLSEHLPTILSKLLGQFKLDSFIHFEITETAATLTFEKATENVLELVNNGLHITLDDFGSGYANFDSIMNLPFKTVKIDRSVLIAGMKDEKARINIECTFEMLKKLNLTIVTEGVETPEQDMWVRRLGTDYIQGFYYAKPMPEDEFLDFINNPPSLSDSAFNALMTNTKEA